MSSKAEERHLLDATIVHLLLHGDSGYRDYLSRVLPVNQRFMPAYVRMEVVRGLICPLINFYCTASMPQYQTIDAAYKGWANTNFHDRQVKVVSQVYPEFISYNRTYDALNAGHKPYLLRRFGSLIVRYIVLLSRIGKDPGHDHVHCHRAQVPLDINITDADTGL